MKKAIFWTILAIIMIIGGASMCAVAFFGMGFRFGEPTPAAVVTNTYEFKDGFSCIDVEVEAESVYLLPSVDDVCRVICTEEETRRLDVHVQNGTLKIDRELGDQRFWFHIGLSSEELSVTIFLPKKEYEKISVESDTGAITLQDVIASEKIDLESDTGKIFFEACDAPKFSAKTDTGDITGTLLSEKIFKAKSDTGKVSVPDTTSGGTCDLKSDMGSIHVELK